jgi:hypothetical protein
VPHPRDQASESKTRRPGNSARGIRSLLQLRYVGALVTAIDPPLAFVRLRAENVRLREELAAIAVESAAMTTERDLLRARVAVVEAEAARLRRADADTVAWARRVTEGIEILKRQLAAMTEWRDSVSNAVKTAPEFEPGQWAGDKEGWGYHFEIVRYVIHNRDSLREQLVAMTAARDEACDLALDDRDGRWLWGERIEALRKVNGL